MAYPILHLNPLDANDEVAGHGIGVKAYYAGSPTCQAGLYQYVKFMDAVTYVAGHCLWWDNCDAFEVTNDESSAEADWVCAGICMRVMTQNYYGWALKEGYHAAAVKKAGDDTLAAGEQMVPDSATPTDGTFVSYLCDPGAAGSPSDDELQALQRACLWSNVLVAGASDDPNDTVPVIIKVS